MGDSIRDHDTSPAREEPMEEGITRGENIAPKENQGNIIRDGDTTRKKEGPKGGQHTRAMPSLTSRGSDATPHS